MLIQKNHTAVETKITRMQKFYIVPYRQEQELTQIICSYLQNIEKWSVLMFKASVHKRIKKTQYSNNTQKVSKKYNEKVKRRQKI